jgi:hypothetical protein
MLVTNRPDAETIGWRALFSQGQAYVLYSSDVTAWADLPSTGVQVIVFYDIVRPYRAARLGDDFYWYFPETGEFDSCTQAEIDAGDKAIPQDAIDRGLVKDGKEIPLAKYRLIEQAALGAGDKTTLMWQSPERENERVGKHG